jgi:hypothetical protein
VTDPRLGNISVFLIVVVVLALLNTCSDVATKESTTDRELSRNRSKLGDYRSVNLAGEIISDAGGMLLTYPELFHQTFPNLNTNYSFADIAGNIDGYRARSGLGSRLQEKPKYSNAQPLSLKLEVLGNSNIKLTVYAMGANRLDDQMTGDDMPLWVQEIAADP